MSLVKETAWSGLAAVLMSAGRLGLAMILARRLGPAQFGEFVFTQWLVEIVFLLGSFGLTGVGTRFFSELRAAGSSTFQKFAVWYRQRALIVIVLVAVLTPAAANIFADTQSVIELIAVSLWAVGNAIWAVAIARAQGLRLFKRVAISSLVFIAVTLGGIVFFSVENNVTGIIIVFGVAAVVSSLACASAVPLARISISSEACSFSPSSVSSYAINVWLAAVISALVWSRAELSVVRGMLNSTDVALYSSALTMSGLASMAIVLLTGALGPKMAYLWGQGLMDEVASLARTVTDILIVVSGAAVGFLITFPGEILNVAFGRGYIDASLALTVLGLGIMGLTCGCVNTVIQYKTNGVFSRNANLAGAILLFVLVILLIGEFGLLGVAIGRCVAQLVVAAGTFVYASYFVSEKVFKVGNIVWMMSLLISLMFALHLMGVVGIFEKTILYTFFLGAFFAIFRIGPEEISMVSWLRRNVVRRIKYKF